MPDASPFSRLTGKGAYPVEYARWLLNPLRRLWCPPSLIVKRLGLNSRDRVLEIGPGPGYFSPAVARAVPQGRLVLFDLQPGMLVLARERLEKRGLSNFECFAGSAVSLPFAEASFDVVFMVTILGEVGGEDERRAAVREAARALKPHGRLSITEMFGDPDYVRMGELDRLASAVGLDFECRFGSSFFYTCNFRKRA